MGWSYLRLQVTDLAWKDPRSGRSPRALVVPTLPATKVVQRVTLPAAAAVPLSTWTLTAPRLLWVIWLRRTLQAWMLRIPPVAAKSVFQKEERLIDRELKVETKAEGRGLAKS